jgi:hypothetical protein
MPQPTIEIAFTSVGYTRIKRQIEELRREASPAAASFRRMRSEIALTTNEMTRQAALLGRARAVMASSSSALTSYTAAQQRVATGLRATNTAMTTHIGFLQRGVATTKALAAESARAAAVIKSGGLGTVLLGGGGGGGLAAGLLGGALGARLGRIPSPLPDAPLSQRTLDIRRARELRGLPAVPPTRGVGAAGLGAVAGLGLGGAAGLAGGGGLLALVGIMGQATTAAGQLQSDMGRLEAVLTATGGAAGLTAEEIRLFTEQLNDETIGDALQLRTAATKLATFKSISGDTFKTTLRLAQDMAALGFGSVEQGAIQLGKSLEDPVRGLTALRRVGISFTQSEQDVIRALTESGRKLEAQRLVLKAVETQIGGAAAGADVGVVGATDRLSDSWRRLLENVGQSDPWTGAINFAAATVEKFDELIQKSDQLVERMGPLGWGAVLGTRLRGTVPTDAELMDQLARARQVLPQAKGMPWEEGTRRQIAELEAQLYARMSESELRRLTGQFPVRRRAGLLIPESEADLLEAAGAGAAAPSAVPRPAGALLRRGERFGPPEPPGVMTYAERLRKGEEARMKGIVPPRETATQAYNQLTQSAQDSADALDLMKGFLGRTSDELSSSLARAAFEASSFGDAMQDMAARIGEQALATGFSALLGAPGMGGAPGSGLFGMLFPGTPTAQHGAVVRQGSAALVEGSRDEAVLPLVRGRGGDLGVQAAGGPKGDVIINADMAGSTITPGSIAAMRQVVFDLLPLIRGDAAASFGMNQGLRKMARVR